MADVDQDDTFFTNNARTLSFTVIDESGDPITTGTMKWVMTRYNRKWNPLLDKTATHAGSGVWNVTIDAGDITTPSIYYHELEHTDVTSKPVVVATGKLTLLDNVLNA